MLSKITLANSEGTDIVLHEDTNASRRVVTHAPGLLGTPPLRESKRVRPQAHGSLNETLYSEGSAITLEGEVWSTASSGAIEAALEEMRKITQVCQETLDNGPALMKWTEGAAGLKLQKMVKLDSDLEPPLEESAAWLRWHAQFFAEDPRAYSQTLTTETGGTITGSEAENEWSKAAASVGGIEVDASHIYWANRTANAIGRAAIGGGTIEPEWIKVTTGVVQDVVVNTEHVYWSTGSGEKIGRAAIGGGTIEQNWLAASGATLSLAVDATFIYFITTKAGARSIARAKLAGTGLEGTFIPELPLTITDAGLAVDAAHIYWGENLGMGRATISGGEINKAFISGISNLAGIAVNATFVYWCSESAKAIGRAKLAGTEVKTALFSGLKGAHGLAIDGAHLYYGAADVGYIGRTGSLTGGPTGSSLAIDQLGNRPTPLTVKIHGPITNPSVVCEADGSRIALTGTVTSGNYVEINVAERTVRLNGSTSALSMLNAQATNWEAFEAPPSSTTYFLTGSAATAAFMEILYRSAYA